MLLEIKKVFYNDKKDPSGTCNYNIDVPNNRAPKYMQQKLAKLKKKQALKQ